MTGKFMSLCLAALAGISAAPLSVPSVSAVAEPAGGISVTEPAGEHYYVPQTVYELRNILRYLART